MGIPGTLPSFYMQVVYQEQLPAGYLLALASSAAPDATETALAACLRQAGRHGQAAVWVDCRLLDALSPQALRLFCACHHRLHRRGLRLVLCGVPEVLTRILRACEPALCLVPTLDEVIEADGLCRE